ncbi:MAG TPA: hypothetical protein PK819_05230, partial [Thermomicrobiales bacterium]|nr:hypothetical protein [Thermomicrobiales bacterium]
MVRRLVGMFAAACAIALLGLFLFGGAASAHNDPNDPAHNHATSETRALDCNSAGRCTHGPDTPISGVSPAEMTAPAFHQAGVDDKAVCDGDGTSGKRIQVLYVYSSTDNYAAYVDSFRYWAAQADLVYQDSAKRTGGARYLRFVHDASCTISVIKVKVSSTANTPGALFTLEDELDTKGYGRNDRKYLIFQDVSSGYYCGIGSMIPDDSPSSSNYNNMWWTTAAVYNGCWADGTTAAHELGHALGAVQSTAPHATAYGHCWDEWDVMCYADGTTHPMETRCSGSSTNDRLLDCNNDDYFNTNPGSGNYLKTHWNMASSDFLGKTLYRMSLNKSSSKFNGKVTASLSGFSPGYYINLKWPDGTVLAQVKAGADGKATVVFRTPLSPLGDYIVRASNSQGESATAGLRVIPRVLLNETSGEAGMKIRIYFYGFAPGDQVEVRFWNEAETSSKVLTTITIASNGRGTKVVYIPTDTTVGKHKIVGKVLGVGRSASTYFTVTSLGTADDPTATPT